MIFQLKDGSLQELEVNPFQWEREIQNLFEAHLTSITGYRLIQSEFPISGYRMDTVCFDSELDAFVIIEYKRGQNESLVDQGFAYLKTVLDRRADFVLLYSEKMNETRRINDFDWSQTRVMFVSPKFTKYQIDATNIDNNAFELYEINRYADDIISIEKIDHERIAAVSSYLKRNVGSKQSNPNEVVSEVEKQLQVYDLAYHYKQSKANQFVQEAYEEMRERILQFDSSLIESFTKLYITYKYNGKNNIVSFWLR